MTAPVIDLLSPKLSKIETLTDLAFARLLGEIYRDEIKYVPPWSSFIAWADSHWRQDDDGLATRAAAEIPALFYGAAAETNDRDLRARLIEHGRKAESARKIRDALTLLGAFCPIRVDRLDRDHFLLNVANGTVDLRTGELREHRKDDLITKIIDVDYDPDAACPTFEAFLGRILPDQEVRDFLRRAFGYSITGSMIEQVLFLLYGSGANGKSSFLELALGLLGDYATKTPAETFLARQSEGITNDLASLRGVRFICSVEVGQDRKLHEPRLKEWTGGDRVTARRLYTDFVTFQPQGKIWIASNYLPRIVGTDEGIWRRVRLIEFGETIPPTERDPHLVARLRAELPGILAWAVRGAVEWSNGGLRAPDAVLLATQKYRSGEDSVAQFIGECCVVNENCWAKSSDIYEAYREWSGDRKTTQKVFGQRMAEKGFIAGKVDRGRTRVWKGIGLEGGAE